MRMLLALLAFSLMAGGLVALPAGTTLASSATLGIDHDGGAPDINAGPAASSGTVTVSLIVEAPPEELGAWEVNVHFDSAVLDGLSCSPYSSGGSAACNPDYPGDIVRVVGADITGTGGTFNLADITFGAVGALGDCSDLTLEVTELTDPSTPTPVPITPVTVGGEVCLTDPNATLGIDHDGGAPDINAGPATFAPGGSATVSLIVEAPPEELGAWTVDIHYDPAVLDPVSCSPYSSGGGAVCNENYSVIEVRVVGADATGTGGTFNLADITFEAVGGDGDCSDLTLEVVTLVDPDAVPILAATSDGEVCVQQPCADVTGDGMVTGRDVARIAFHMLLRRYSPLYDLNDNGRIDRWDIRMAASQIGTPC